MRCEDLITLSMLFKKIDPVYHMPSILFHCLSFIQTVLPYRHKKQRLISMAVEINVA